MASEQTLSQRTPAWKAIRPFALSGAAACTATFCIQPIDMIKVRIQLQEGGGGVKANTNPFSVGSTILRNEGPLAFYKGLSAAIFRQLTYGVTRLGLFKTLSEKFTPEGGKLTFAERVGLSLLAGGVGALVGTPADAALIRMQADSTLPAADRRHYKNVVDALIKMARNEGVKGVFTGGGPTILRALAVNVGQLSTYDTAKDKLGLLVGSEHGTLLLAGFISGFSASALSLPFDFIKTRLQKQKAGPDGKLQYKGVLDCAKQVAAKEGIFTFYNGFGAYVIRISPHIMITWAVLEYLNNVPFLK